MDATVVGAIVFICTFGGALFGLWLRTMLREHHLVGESRDTVKVGIGLVATMTALVLGLVTASAKSSFDAVDTAVKQSATQILALDRALTRYGPETGEIREGLKHAVGTWMDMIWPQGSSKPVNLDLMLSGAASRGEGLADAIRSLKPRDDSHRALQSRALDLIETIMQTRWLVLAGTESSVPLPFHCGSPVLAHDYIRELWGVCSAERNGPSGSLRLCTVYWWRLISRIGDGLAVRRLDQGLCRSVALRI